ncbi:MAG: PilW family protein [Oceanospirillaceae bacterium]
MTRQQGYSLVEILIASMLGLLLSSLILSTLYATVQSNNLKKAQETIQENAALAFHFLANDLRSIGFNTCFSGSRDELNNLSNGVVGNQLIEFGGIEGNKYGYKKSDSITIIATLFPASELLIAMSAVHSDLDLMDNNVQLGQELLLTDCNHAELFTVTGMWANSIGHESNMNNDANFNRIYHKGALLYPLSLISYKLARGVSGNTGLFRAFNNGRFQELVPNIEQLHIEYGESLEGQDLIKYSDANAVTNFSKVVGISLKILMRSTDQVLSDAMTIEDAFGKISKLRDKHFYKMFTLHIALRNKELIRESN